MSRPQAFGGEEGHEGSGNRMRNPQGHAVEFELCSQLMVLITWSPGQQHQHHLELIRNAKSGVQSHIYRVRNLGEGDAS